MDGHDAPISLSPTIMSRPEEGLQYHPEVETSIMDANIQQAPSPFPENDDRRQSIPWETHPRRFSIVQDDRRRSMAQAIESRRSANSAFPPPHRRQTTTTMSVLSDQDPPDEISLSQVDRQELDSQATKTFTEESKDAPPSETTSRRNHPYLRRLQPHLKAWRYILPILTLTLLAILIALILLYTHAKHSTQSPPSLSILTTTQSLAPPLTDTALTATILLYSSLLDSSSSPNPSSDPTTLLAYTTSNNSICIRTSTSSDWLTPVQCITSLPHPLKPRSPLAILDWYGGPSIYYISHTNQLSGIDNVPQNNTWVPSSLNTQSPPPIAHPDSQLSAVTWLNGSSAWLYYQDVNMQLREYGLDDYRDKIWRNGALGPLGLALQGTGIATARYLLDGGEVLEAFVQVDNDALHGRVYADSVWEPDWYAVDGTESGLSPNAAVTATVAEQEPGMAGDGEKVWLAWTNGAGFVNVQSRATVNVTAYNVFTAPKQLVEGDGGQQPGLAATGSDGAKVYFADGVKILELFGNGSDIMSGNWTSVDITSL